jgi:hypothetical protein
MIWIWNNALGRQGERRVILSHLLKHSRCCQTYVCHTYLVTHGMELREHLCQQYESLSRLFCTLVEATVCNCMHLNALLPKPFMMS